MDELVFVAEHAGDQGAVAGLGGQQLAVRAGGGNPAVRPGSAPRPPGRAAPARWSRRTVPRPARAAASRSAMAASVCASTAEVGSTASSISGSAWTARASRTRCRWPPDRLRPAQLDRPAQVGRHVVRDRGGDRCPDPVVVRVVPAGHHLAQRAGEQVGVVVGDQRAGRAPRLARSRPAGGRPRWRRSGRTRPRRSSTAAASAGVPVARAVSRPGSAVTPDSGSCRAPVPTGAGSPAVSSTGRRRKAVTRRAATTPCTRSKAQKMQHGHRDHQHRGVAVDGQQLAGRELGRRAARRAAGQITAARNTTGRPSLDARRSSSTGRRPGNPGRAAPPTRARSGLRWVGLAAEAVQHPQAAEHVDQPGVQLALLLPVARAGPLGAAEQRPDHQRQDRHADQDDHGQQRRDPEQQDRDRDAGHGRGHADARRRSWRGRSSTRRRCRW